MVGVTSCPLDNAPDGLWSAFLSNEVFTMGDAAAIYKSPLGLIRLRAEGGALTELEFTDEAIAETNTCPVIEESKRWLDEYFAGRCPDFMPRLLLKGTDFQLSVWRHLQEIPYGQTASYGQLAKLIAKERGLEKMSARAVGAAAGKNHIMLMVPCHRLIGSDGSLTGFANGIEIKRELLRIEKSLLL